MLSKFVKQIISFTLTTSLCFMVTTNAVFADTINQKEKTPEKQAQEIVSKMTLEEKVGQMLMPDFRTWNGEDLTEMNDEIANVVKTYHLGGVILFAENIQGTEQTVRLTDGLQKSSEKIPLLLTTDQEGGIVTRINGGTCMPGNMALGAANDKDLTYRTAKAMGEEVSSLGINVNFAPDIDINCNPDNPVIGVRSFAADPDIVANMGLSFIKGVQDAGVIATVKHFPGHGDVSTDSHLGLPVVPYDRDRLDKVELKPFKAAIDGGVDMIMTAHIEFPTIDDTKVVSKKDGKEILLPATLSKKVLTGLLKDELGYKGVIVTDALNMKAISDNFGRVETVLKAIDAGTDIALMPAIVHGTDDVKNLDEVFKAVINAVNDGNLSIDRINESATKIIALKIRRGIYNPNDNKDTKTLEEKIEYANKIVGNDEHRAIEKEAANKGVTLVKNEGNVLPFKLEDSKKVLCLGPWDTRLKGMTEEVKNIAKKKGFNNVEADGIVYASSSSGSKFALDEVTKASIDNADYVILGTYTYNKSSREADSKYVKYANQIIDYAQNQGKSIAVIGIRNPYEIAQMPKASNFIGVYGRDGIGETRSWQNIQAGVRAVFGEINPTGKLPVAIPTADNSGILYDIGYGLSYGKTPDGDQTGKNSFTITAEEKLNRTSGITASVSIDPTKDAVTHEGNEVVVFQLMKGTVPQDIVALQKDISSKETLKAYFNVSDFKNSNYSVKVFVLDNFNSNISVPKSLAEPVELK